MIASSIKGNTSFIFLRHFDTFFAIEFFKFLFTIYNRLTIFLWEFGTAFFDNMSNRINIITITAASETCSF